MIRIAIIIILAWLIWNLLSFLRNYAAARRIGLPIVISPIYPLNPVWILLHKRVLPILKAFPWNSGLFVRCCYGGWTFDDKYHLHEELGDAFVIVNPGQLELWISEAKTASLILSKRKNFPKPVDLYKPIEIFGPNVDSVEGDDWQRQRKLTTPPFGERVSVVVWQEAIRQAQDMLQAWLSKGDAGTRNSTHDMLSVALNVLSCAGFGISHPFGDHHSKLPAGHTMHYRDALSMVLKNLVLLVVFPHRMFTLPFLPFRYTKLGQAIAEFRKYMVEIVEQERKRIEKRDPGLGNLASALIHASEEAKTDSNSQIGGGLTDNEIYGNIFIYNLAGHETTAYALIYSVYLLSVHPDVQNWMGEELERVLGGQPQVDVHDYPTIFPQLQRLRAVMFETLRLYNLTMVPKCTGNSHQPLALDAHHHVIPPNTYVMINMQSLHTSPLYWGADSLDWRPSRWIQKSSSGTEHFLNPRNGSFIPWAEGPRVCPARKFAQVEFVATLMTLFRRHRVRPALLMNEDQHMAKVRVLRVINSSALVITLQMRDPGAVSLVWREET